MPNLVQFEIVSTLPAAADAVWRRVSTPAGINDELWPFHMRLRQDLLAAASRLHSASTPGVLISLCGLLPIDWHWLGLERVTPGRGFREVSSSLWMRHWVHERTIEPAGERCTLCDRVELTPRVALLAPLLGPLYRAVFRRRHRRLIGYLTARRRSGVSGISSTSSLI